MQCHTSISTGWLSMSQLYAQLKSNLNRRVMKKRKKTSILRKPSLYMPANMLIFAVTLGLLRWSIWPFTYFVLLFFCLKWNCSCIFVVAVLLCWLRQISSPHKTYAQCLILSNLCIMTFIPQNKRICDI